MTVDVEDEGRIVGSEKVELPSDGSPATVRIRAKASEPGPRLFRFRVAPQDGEVVTQNNVREAHHQRARRHASASSTSRASRAGR